MKIACVYTVESFADVEKPLSSAREIPFGISIIATVLKKAGHDVQLFVFSPKSSYREILEKHLLAQSPELLCLTAVSTQFHFVRKIAELAKEINPSIFTILGGHHASLDAENVIKTPSLDAICVGEGDRAVVTLAHLIESGQPITNIPHLHIKRDDNTVEKNEPSPFDQDLDALPYIDRKLWEPWIMEPGAFPSVLLGRGCPFKCTYCANHAMNRLSTGRYVRFRSPESIIGEIEYICGLYPNVKDIYLEVETIGANPTAASDLFLKLEDFNSQRKIPINFGVNFSLTSTFMRNEETSRKFLSMLRRSHVTYLNIGLESGSERIRKELLFRPNYTNKELIQFTQMSKEYGINLYWYVLIGVPGETLADYYETVRVCREGQPKQVNLSIFYPYLGTDLCDVALEQGLVTREELNPTAERARAILDLPGFSSRQIRREYILFWFKVYRGHWSLDRILAGTARSFLAAYPRLYSMVKYLTTHNRVFRSLRQRYAPRGDQFVLQDLEMSTPTRVDFFIPVREE